MMRAAVRWQLDNRPLLALFGDSYMANPERPTRIPLLAILEQLLHAGAAAGVLRSVDAGDEHGLHDTAAIVLDVVREATGRAVVAHPDETPLDTAEQFLERALDHDHAKARTVQYELPAPEPPPQRGGGGG
jgi:hypothetical protein